MHCSNYLMHPSKVSAKSRLSNWLTDKQIVSEVLQLNDRGMKGVAGVCTDEGEKII